MITRLWKSCFIKNNCFAISNQKPMPFKPKPIPLKTASLKPQKGEISLSSVAQKLDINQETIKKQLNNQKINYISPEQIRLLSIINGKQATFQQESSNDLNKKSPVVTIMGHVDHGKTTLIDFLRHSDIAQGQVGGITQKIGAFHINCHNQKITFIDTPGHQAFSNMRRRGARVTDLIVLIVAATEGVKKQTRQVIQIINKEQIKTIVAINKIDLENAVIQQVEDSLFEAGLNIEPKGGNIPVVHISAKTGQNINLLSELILEQTSQLKAISEGLAQGIVLQAYQNQQGLNAMTLIVKQGTLKTGSMLIIGDEYAKIKTIQDDSGKLLNKANPGDAVQVIGIPTIPTAGDFVYEVEDEAKAKYIKAKRKQVLADELHRQQEKTTLKTSKIKLKRRQRRSMYNSASQQSWLAKFAEKEEQIMQKLQKFRSIEDKSDEIEQLIMQTEDELKNHKEYVYQFLVNIGVNKNNFNVILKFADRGIEETIHEQLEPIIEKLKEKHNMTVNILKSDVGEITVSDLEEAETCKADIFTFGTQANIQAATYLKQYQIVPKIHRLIHNFLKDFQETGINKKRVGIKGTEKGRGKVAQVFKIKGKKGTDQIKMVPGVRVQSGKVSKNHKIYVFRNGTVASQGYYPKVIKVFKKEVTQVKKGQQCTITIDFNEDFTVQRGDEIVAFEE